jgi:hypothetical protein
VNFPLNQKTQDHWKELNSKVIKPSFSRKGNILEKLNIGMRIEKLWWCDNENQSIRFSPIDKDKFILEL